MKFINIKGWSWKIYLFNLSLLITHEIDSAYWQEWNLFGIPGGIQVFLIINFLVVVAGLVGFKYVLFGVKAGNYFALVLALSGILAFCIHSAFILKGFNEFRLPASVILLVVTLFVSLLQGISVIQVLRKK